MPTMTAKEQVIYMPAKAQTVIASTARYKVLYGGRGSGKSFSFADALVCRAVFQKLRILCTREMQNSIRDSVHKLLTDRIHSLGFDDYFIINKDAIYSRIGSEIIFKGLRHNISEIKSTEGLDLCWVEEAEKVSQNSWDILIPTIRKEKSEIWISFNPEDEKSATYQKFVVNTPPDCAKEFMTWRDNKYFPDVLMRELEYDKRVDNDKYLHVWEGQIKRYGANCIFANKIKIEDFETPEDVRFYYGADWGFSNDPTVLGRMFIKDRKLYLDYEFYAVGIEITELENAFDSVPGSRKWEIIADCERPDTISFMEKRGFNIRGAEKGKGSVEDGIQFLRSFEEIVIHPRCRGAVDNFSNYKWKQDKITQEILPIPVDASNHWPDAARYALEPYIKAKEPNIRIIEILSTSGDDDELD
jgi:phage terminase large subunit